MTLDETERVIEGLLFASPYPISVTEIGSILQLDAPVVKGLIERVKQRYTDSGLMIREVAGGFQFVTRPEMASWIEKLERPVSNQPLSTAALETLSIVAYRQPLTKAEIEQIRGVRSDSAINSLLERELIIESGRKEGPGRPILYVTSDTFLIHFGLGSLDELPAQTANLTSSE